jgi:hypothetical protein
MPGMASATDSKRLAVILIGGAVLLLIVGGFVYPRWARHRERVRALDEFASGLDEATLAYEKCVTATDDPSAYGRSILEQLRTRDFKDDYGPAVNACARDHERRIDEIRELVDATTWPLRSRFTYYLPQLELLCSEIEQSRADRREWLVDLRLGDRDPLPEFDCRVPEIEVRTLAPAREDAKHWDVRELPSGELLIADRRGPDPRYAHVKSDEPLTWFVPPSALEHHRFAPFHPTAKQPFLLSHDPQDQSRLMLGTWLGSPGDPEQFEQRPLAPGNPTLVLTSLERWVFVHDHQGSVELRISDDEGESFTTVQAQYPREFLQNTMTSPWGYLVGKQLFLLMVRESTEGEPSLVFVVRVDEAGTASTSSLDFEHVHRRNDLFACATAKGAFATIGRHLVLHVDAAPTVIHDFAPAKTIDLACQGERAAVLVADDSAGRQRYVCSDRSCGDPALLSRFGSSSLRSTAEGVRAVLLSMEGDDLHVVDEPLGGPFERIERLANGKLDGQDLPLVIEGHLYGGSVRAEEFFLESLSELPDYK